MLLSGFFLLLLLRRPLLLEVEVTVALSSLLPPLLFASPGKEVELWIMIRNVNVPMSLIITQSFVNYPV